MDDRRGFQQLNKRVLNERYALENEIGRGGMGVVYKARDIQLGRYVAIKVLPAEFGRDIQFLERFRREVLNSAKLDHPNIVHVYDVGVDNGCSYYVMQLVQGGSLRTEIDLSAQFEVERALLIVSQIAAALDYAHSAGIIHRDVKSDNILVDRHGNAQVVDFGIARSVDGTPMTGGIIGTPEYMSPEQARGEELDGRSDQYSLAIVAYEMLTGTTPFRSDTTQPWALVNKHITVQPPDPRTMRSDLPDQLSDALMQALAKNPDQRFSSCFDFAQALAGQKRDVTFTQATAKLDSEFAGNPEKSSKHLAMKAVALLGVALVTVTIGAWLVFGNPAKNQVSSQQDTSSGDSLSIPPLKVNQQEPKQTPVAPYMSRDGEASEERTTSRESAWSTHEDFSLGYSIDRPDDWSSEQLQNAQLNTMLFKAPAAGVSIRVDAMVDIPEKDPIESWEGLETRFKKVYGSRYQRVSMDYSTLGGERSATWVFTLQKRGQPVLKKIDVGLYHNGTGYAVLCTAPVDSFESWQSTFDRAIASFRFTAN
ncbi:MAG: serine/threonine protein kinase [Armatimonadetes bacterium]|jgi:serine/threonine protein kinase|nr:serine/threonine protein kinase [Armatimonadota bacterium]